MNKSIRHCGVIESINGCRAHIRTLRTSACSTCEASAGCKGVHGKDFHVDIEDKRLAGYSPGDRVLLEMPADRGRQAVLIGFGLPLVIFVMALLVARVLADDIVAAAVALAALAVYYIIIYMLRRVLNSHFAIHLAE